MAKKQAKAKPKAKAKVMVRMYATKVERHNSRGATFDVELSADDAKAAVESGYGELVKAGDSGKEKAIA